MSKNLFIIASIDSLAKKQPQQSKDLAKNEIINFPKGKTYPVESWKRASNGHLEVKLGFGAGTWFFYDPHVQILDEHGVVVDSAPSLNYRTTQSRRLTEEDYAHGADMLGCSIAALKAVVAVESSGFGFLSGNKPKILFEAHWFSQLTKRRFDRSHPNISSPYWNRSLYLGGLAEYSRLATAMSLDRSAAIQSASWGLFQVMGFHYRLAYGSIEAFYDGMHESEWKQLEIAIAFIKNKGLDRHLRTRSWAAFAYGYNGNGYRANQYDRKLRDAFNRFNVC